MPIRLKNIRIFTFQTLVMSFVFVLSGIFLVLTVNHYLKQSALEEAKVRARIILDRNLATHTYFSRDLKPGLFSLTDSYRPRDYFDPTWMSSTYAVRQIDSYFKSFGESDYYYKECAIHARSPENEADEYEKDFIQCLNRDAGLIEQTAVRTFGGKPYLVVLRKGEVMETTCLRCHSVPANAPAEMVRRYGTGRSFHRSAGDVVSAISIRVPLEAAYASTNRVIFLISALLLITLALLFGIQQFLGRRLLFNPLRRIQDKAVQIATDEKHLGEEIDVSAGKELHDMITAFNSMSVILRHDRDHLEERVRARTRDLQKALEAVKQLSGMLPICSSCKKIRDDEGYWKQIEEYIHEHSEAEFTHSICPDCARKLYPDYLPKDE